MTVYIVLFIYTCLIGLIAEKRKQLSEKKLCAFDSHKVVLNIKGLLWMIIIFIPLWLVMGLRYGIGTDFRNYEAIFNTTNQYGRNIYHVESGYFLLNKVVAFFSDESQAIFIVVAFLMLLFFIRGFAYNNHNLAIQFAVFMGTGYYFYAMNIMRQYLAISVMCFAYRYLERKEYIKWTVFLIIAFLFHQSALIWIPIYLFIRFTDTKLFYSISLFVAVFFRFGFSYILKFILRYVPYAHYFISRDSLVKERISWANVAITGMVILAYFVFRKKMIKIRESNSERIKYVWIMFLSYLFLNVLGDSIIRLVLHFFFIIPAILADFFECFSKWKKLFLKLLFMVMMGILMCYLLNYSGNIYNHFVPYVNCFEKM